MNINTRKLLVPQYMKNFRCIGSVCEDTCCIGWTVSVDEETYKKYRKCNNIDLKELLVRKVTRNRSFPNNINYAKIRINEDGSCPFLSEQKLCNIQSVLGEEYLSLVCETYPRVSNMVNMSLEKCATMSCPEIVRLALLNPAIMEFDEVEESTQKRNIIYRKLDTEENAFANKPQRYFWELRIFTISIMQKREYNLWERLIILGLFYKKLKEYLTDGKVHDLPRLIASYSNMASERLFKDLLEEIPTLSTIQLELLKEITDQRVIQGVNSKRYLECFSEFIKGITYSDESNKAEIAERYADAYSKYYAPYMDKHEYILENYLVNYVFKNLFPFSGQKDIFDDYMMMIIHYAMIKMNLIGMAGFHKENFDTEHVVKLIQSFSKTVEHHSEFLKYINYIFKKHNFDTMAYMSVLIKN